MSIVANGTLLGMTHVTCSIYNLRPNGPFRANYFAQCASNSNRFNETARPAAMTLEWREMGKMARALAVAGKLSFLCKPWSVG